MWLIYILWKNSFVRSGIRTHAWKTRLRPERSALDRSAILTWHMLEVRMFISFTLGIVSLQFMIL